MIKITAILLLACVCLARCEEIPEIEDTEVFSESALQPTDSEEVANLKGQQLIFSDFCLRARDYVIEDMKKTSNELASRVFTLFFRSAEELGVEALETGKEATSQLGDQLRNPSQPLGDSANDVVGNGKRGISEKSTAAGFLQAITSTLAAIKNTVAEGVKNRIMSMQKQLGLAQAASALVESCSKVGEYEEELKSRFSSEISAIGAKDAALAKTTLDQVPCLTSGRILKIEGLCKFARIAHAPLMRILTTFKN